MDAWRQGRRQQAERFRRRVALGLRGKVVEMMVVDRAFVRRALATSMDEGVLLLGRGRRDGSRRLDGGADTGPEQDEGEEEGDHPKGHVKHCSQHRFLACLRGRTTRFDAGTRRDARMASLAQHRHCSQTRQDGALHAHSRRGVRRPGPRALRRTAAPAQHRRSHQTPHRKCHGFEVRASAASLMCRIPDLFPRRGIGLLFLLWLIERFDAFVPAEIRPPGVQLRFGERA